MNGDKHKMTRGSEQPRKEINNVKFAADREKNE